MGMGRGMKRVRGSGRSRGRCRNSGWVRFKGSFKIEVKVGLGVGENIG